MANEQVQSQDSGSAIGLNDMALVVRIIDIAAERGTFKGPDLQTVGALRTKFVDFVKKHNPPAAEASSEGEEAPAAEADAA